MAGITLPAVAAAVAEEIPKIFDDAFNRARDGGPSTIKDGNPTSIPGKIGQAAARSACRRYGADPTSFPANRRERIEAACRPYLDDIAPGNGAGIAIPFEGGQCPGAILIGEVQGINSVSQVPFSQKFKTRGPLVSAQNAMNGAAPIFQVTSGGSVIATALCTGTAPGIGPVQARQFGGTRDPNLTIQGVTVTQICPGSLDNCGNPPPVIRQPQPQPDPTPPPFRFNPGPFVDIDVDVDVLPDGTINVNVGGPTFNVDPFSGGDDGGDSGGNDPVGGPGSPGGSGDTGAGGSDEGSADEGEELVGVLVQVLSAPEGANRFFNNSEIVYRGAYYVAMGYPGRLGLDMSGGTAETLQFFHAQQRGLTDHRVRANVGFNLRVTPYYRELES